MSDKAHYSTLTAIAGGFIVALIAGVAVSLWIVPTASNDVQPPVCFGTFGNVVACGSAPAAFTWAALVAVLAGVAASLVTKRVPARHLEVSVAVK